MDLGGVRLTGKFENSLKYGYGYGAPLSMEFCYGNLEGGSFAGAL